MQITDKIKYLNGFTIFVIVISITIFIFDNINHKFFLNDYKVYYLAARSFLSGDTVYGVAFGLTSGFYKYSPIILLFFIPLSLLPFYISSVIFYIIIVFSIIVLFHTIRAILNNYIFKTVPKHESVIYSISFLFVLNQIYRELHLGNTNIILVLLLMLSLWNLHRSKHLYSGLFFGLAVLFKPYFLIFMLPLVFFKQWKIIFYGVVSALIPFLLFILFFNFGKTIQLLNDWIKAILYHSTSYISTNSFDSILRFYANTDFTNYLQYIIIGATGILYFVYELHIAHILKKQKINSQTAEIRNTFGWFILLALLPNVVNTDTEHFLYCIPLIIFITHYIITYKKLNLGIFFFILFLLHGTNSIDIVGRYLSDIITKYGILGISNFIIVILGAYLIVQTFRRKLI